MQRRLCTAALAATFSLLLAGCQQPYRVFAVQVARAATPQVAPLDPPAAASTTAPQAKPRLPRARLGQKWALNQVPASTLQKLPGIDEATVHAIIAGRPYRAKRDLLKRHILTPIQYARWKDYLVVHRAYTKMRTAPR